MDFSSTKRKRQSISLELKLSIVKDAETKNIHNLATKYNFGESTIRGILKNQNKILKTFGEEPAEKRTNKKGGKLSDLEAGLLSCLKLAKSLYINVDGRVLQVRHCCLIWFQSLG